MSNEERLEFQMGWCTTTAEYTNTWLLSCILDDYAGRLDEEVEQSLVSAQKGDIILLPNEGEEISVEAECLGTYSPKEEYPTSTECHHLDWYDARYE